MAERTVKAEQGADVKRLGFFGDAVFAVLLVMLAQHFVLPENYVKSDVLHDSIGDTAPELAGAALAFGVIGLLWADHHRLFNGLNAIDNRTFWMNFAFLGAVVLASYPAVVFEKHLGAPVAAYVFAGAIAICALLLAALCTSAGTPRVVALRPLVMPAVFLLAAPLVPLVLEFRGTDFSLAIPVCVVAVPAARLLYARRTAT